MNDVERLEWVVRQAEARLEGHAAVKVRPETFEVFWVTATMIATAVKYGKAMATLLRGDLLDAAWPVERALLELYNDFQYLLRHESAQGCAIKILISATIELLEFHRMEMSTRSDESIATLEESLANYGREFPELYAEVREQRKRRKFHWSGLSRIAIEKIVAPDAGMYKYLSWQAHSIITPLHGLSLTMAEEHIRVDFTEYRDAFVNPGRAAWSVGGLLLNMWNEFARFSGVPSIRTLFPMTCTLEE